jgi:hypothetical protein
VVAPVRCAPVRHHGPSHTAAQPTPTSPRCPRCPRWRAVRTFLTAIKVSVALLLDKESAFSEVGGESALR